MKIRNIVWGVFLLAAGCHVPATDPWPWLSFPPPPFDGLPWDFFRWKAARPVMIDLGRFPGLDLSAINGDRFFPSDARRILVAPDAVETGFFQRPQGRGPLFAHGMAVPAPEGGHTLRVRVLPRRDGLGGSEQLIEVRDERDAVTQQWWSLGRFTEIYWSPDGRYFGFNEQGLSTHDRRRFSIVEVARQELLDLDMRIGDGEEDLRALDVGTAESMALRGWVSSGVIVLWIHGDYDESSYMPRWGYEVVVDLGLPAGQNNARLLRAFSVR